MEPVEQAPDLQAGLDLTFEVDNVVTLRSAVAAHGSEFGLEGERIGDLVLIAHELASNAVSHGGGRGRLRLWRDGDYVHCQVSDSGNGLADPAGAGRERPVAGATGGRGLWLVRALAAAVQVESGPGGTAITASLRVDPVPLAGQDAGTRH
jgi:anti-sigma regulatory factor (Ser/Thr protein kinase)